MFAQNTESEQARFFDRRVAPILTKRCLGCHNNDLDDGGISFENRESLLKKAVVVPLKPEASRLIYAIRHDGDVKMPPGRKLPEKEISVLTEWVRQGAVWGTKLRVTR